jgi:RNA polymerase-binding transcription factor DksA
MPIPTKTTVAVRKATLVDLKATVEARLAAIEEELDSHHDPDWEDLAGEREGDEVLETSGLSGQHDLRQIDAALHRIERGDYGVCVKCGAEIEEQRLDVLPATPFCRACAT